MGRGGRKKKHEKRAAEEGLQWLGKGGAGSSRRVEWQEGKTGGQGKLQRGEIPPCCCPIRPFPLPAHSSPTAAALLSVPQPANHLRHNLFDTGPLSSPPILLLTG